MGRKSAMNYIRSIRKVLEQIQNFVGLKTINQTGRHHRYLEVDTALWNC